MKARITRAVAVALFILGLLAAGTAPYGDPDTMKPRGNVTTDLTTLAL